MCFVVIDEIIRIPRSNPGKAIYLQMLENLPDRRREMRVCYFMISRNGRTKGRWVFGQFAPMIRQKDLEYLLRKARQRGWINN